MPYEVDTADGRCLYRGEDIELACEIHDQVPTAVLTVLRAGDAIAPTTARRTEAPWKGPSVTPPPTRRGGFPGWTSAPHRRPESGLVTRTLPPRGLPAGPAISTGGRPDPIRNH